MNYGDDLRRVRLGSSSNYHASRRCGSAHLLASLFFRLRGGGFLCRHLLRTDIRRRQKAQRARREQILQTSVSELHCCYCVTKFGSPNNSPAECVLRSAQTAANQNSLAAAKSCASRRGCPAKKTQTVCSAKSLRRLDQSGSDGTLAPAGARNHSTLRPIGSLFDLKLTSSVVWKPYARSLRLSF